MRILVRDDGTVLPNLERITGKDDDLARSILARLPRQLLAASVADLDERSRLALGRYGTRAVTLALREGSLDRLREGLLSSALYQAAASDDTRDAMVGMALAYVAAQDLGCEPPVVFGEVARRFEGSEIANDLRTFASRSDVTLEAFGWRPVDTPAGRDFIPT